MVVLIVDHSNSVESGGCAVMTVPLLDKTRTL